jgi:hypothetical protein
MAKNEYKPLYLKASDNFFYLFIRKLEKWEDHCKYEKWIEEHKLQQTIQLEEMEDKETWKTKKCWVVYQQVPINIWIQADYDIRYIYDPIEGRIEPYHIFHDNEFFVDPEEIDSDLEKESDVSESE